MNASRRLRFLAVSLLTAACTAHQTDAPSPAAIDAVRVTTNPGAVRDCRVIRHVDSRDTSLGCGGGVAATAEECLRYQVVRAGGDTLLMRGAAGEAYDCGGARPAAAAPSRPPAPTAAPASPGVASPTPAPERAAAPAPAAAAPEPPPVRATADRASARGCVYLGDLSWTPACGSGAGAASGPCAEEARQLGGNLVVHDGSRAEAFWCRPSP